MRKNKLWHIGLSSPWSYRKPENLCGPTWKNASCIQKFVQETCKQANIYNIINTFIKVTCSNANEFKTKFNEKTNIFIQNNYVKLVDFFF